MPKKVLMPISDGFEEIEAMTIVDILRRADIDVIVAALTDGPVTGRSHVRIHPDQTLDAARTEGPYDMVVLPGGMPNAYTLRDDERVIEILQKTHQQGKYVAAICAAPAALERAGLLKNIRATIYPGMEGDIASAICTDAAVVESGQVITSRGPATAMEFALTLVLALDGPDASSEVARAVLARVE